MPYNDDYRRLSDKEKEIVERLGHSLYTVSYLEEWINRNDSVFINAPAALNAMAAHGYFEAVQAIAKKEV